ncbi:hypothetical protein V1281_002580 [Nitrobacteraceae bacterium AZCC 2161]
MSISRSIYLLEIDAWTGSAVETLYLGTRTIVTSPSDTPANTPYRGLIVDAGKIGCSISLSGATTANFGAIILNNQGGDLDAWFNYGFDGREFRLKELSAPTLPVSGATLLFRGAIEGVDGSDALRTLRLRVQDKLADLDQPLLSSRYLGTTVTAGATAEGGESLADVIKQRIWGYARNASGQRVNEFNLIDKWSDGAVAEIRLYDGLSPLTLTSDYPTLQALVTAPLVGGQYATCLSSGLTRVGINPFYRLTADVTEAADAAQRSAARVAQRMLMAFGAINLDTASFDELHATNPAAVGIVVNDDRSAADAVQRVLSSVGASLIATLSGQFRVVLLSEPAAVLPSDTFSNRDIVSGASFSVGAGLASAQDAIPAWRVVLGYGPIWQTMGSGDIVPGIEVDQAVREEYASQYRQAAAADATVKIAHLRAGEMTADTVLVERSDALAEAARRLALQKVRRDALSAPLIDFARGSREIGDVVAVRLDRIGLEASKNFRVVGRTHDFQKRVITLDLWG